MCYSTFIEKGVFTVTLEERDSKVEVSENGEKYKQRSYYLTDDLLKAITIKTAETNLDKSGVVREALKMYLADILKKI